MGSSIKIIFHNKINKVIIFLFCFASISGTCNQSTQVYSEYKITIDKLTQGGISEWYQIRQQFINQNCSNNKDYASVYLCTKKITGDTVLIVSPCVQNKYEINSGAALFIDDNVKIGKTVLVSIPKKYSTLLDKKERIVFGTLKVPTQ